ncbi:hypothetical protein BC826DRAFT_980898 [Russula brevipes]|nr:hypothetical protein BC826DRAFT_980898 [Russula brevipes]
MGDTKPSLSRPTSTSPFRNRSHRKRFSVTRLSTDTTATLPAYPRIESLPDDRPPDYPESANEADADTDHSSSDDTLLPLASPHPYLDSLLARSSSITTHSSLSAVLAADSPVVESSLETRARNLSSRIGVNSGVHANWLDDLTAISEHLTADSRPDALGLSLAHDDPEPISRSLPLRSPRRHHRNHSSTDLRRANEPHLPPRAITQYVESNADPHTILLPSTLASHSTLAESSAKAYTVLSSFLMRRPSTSSTTSHPSSGSRSGHPTSSSHASSTVASSRTRTPFSSPTVPRAGKRSFTPPLVPPPLNPSLSSLSSTSSSNPSSDPHPNPVLSVQALRKILDDQPNAPPMSPRRPTFLPRTPLPPPTLGTSTATASVSRLFTKPVHMHSGSSSREPRPPAESDGFLAAGRSTGAGGSSGSSARSTPKRISERGGGGSGRGGSKGTNSKGNNNKGKGKSKIGIDGSDESDDSDSDDDYEKGWWARLLLGSASARSLSLGRAEDRIEARIARGLGNRGGGFGGGMEDWAV